MPFVAGFGASWSLGWFGSMVNPLVLAVLVAGACATILRPYSPDEDYQRILLRSVQQAASQPVAQALAS